MPRRCYTPTATGAWKRAEWATVETYDCYVYVSVEYE